MTNLEPLKPVRWTAARKVEVLIMKETHSNDPVGFDAILRNLEISHDECDKWWADYYERGINGLKVTKRTKAETV